MTAPELPSLSAFQAFDAALRHHSFTRAAAELHRTQGAISRQVQALERQLEVTLFEREHPNIHPTAAAEVLGRRVRRALDQLETAVLEARNADQGGGTLHLAILPTFGTSWLIPRIRDFFAAHPDVLIHFSTRLHPFDFAVEEHLDAAIHQGTGEWPGAGLERLFPEQMIVVASPGLRRRERLRKPEHLLAQKLLHLRSRPEAWPEWFAASRVPPNPAARRGPQFEQFAMVIQAAIASLGVAVVPEFLVRDELASGALVGVCPRHVSVTGRDYWLAFPQRSQAMPAFASFRTWLRERVAQEREGLPLRRTGR